MNPRALARIKPTLSSDELQRATRLTEAARPDRSAGAMLFARAGA